MANLQQVPAEKVRGEGRCGLKRYGIHKRNKGKVLFMDIYGYLWIFMDIYGYLWIFMDLWVINIVLQRVLL